MEKCRFPHGSAALDGRNRARTCDLPRVKRTLSQLSYAPRERAVYRVAALRPDVVAHVVDELREAERLRQAGDRAEPAHLGDLGLDAPGGHHDHLEVVP